MEKNEGYDINPLEIDFEELLAAESDDSGGGEYQAVVEDSALGLVDQAMRSMSSDGTDSGTGQSDSDEVKGQTDRSQTELSQAGVKDEVDLLGTKQSDQSDQSNKSDQQSQSADIRELLAEVRRKLEESELLEYARRQGDLIEKEIRQLNLAGIRVPPDEVQQVVKEAFEKGIEPYIYFKSYASDLLKNQAIFGDARAGMPIRTNRPPSTVSGTPVTSPSSSVDVRNFAAKDPNGLIPLDYFLAEELENL